MGIKQDGVREDGERCGSGVSTLVAFPFHNQTRVGSFGRWGWGLAVTESLQGQFGWADW